MEKLTKSQMLEIYKAGFEFAMSIPYWHVTAIEDDTVNVGFEKFLNKLDWQIMENAKTIKDLFVKYLAFGIVSELDVVFFTHDEIAWLKELEKEAENYLKEFEDERIKSNS